MDEVLFLAHRIPYPPDRGDKIRSWHMVRHLGTLAKVHLACFADDETDAAHLAAFREAMGDSLGEAHVEVRRRGRLAAAAIALAENRPVSLTLFDSRAMRTFVHDLLARRPIGTIFAYSGQMAQFAPVGATQRFVMDFVDMDSAKFADYGARASVPSAWVHRREAAKLMRFERATAARADVSLFVSRSEAALFHDRTGLAADIRAIQNGIDLAHYDPEASFPRVQKGEGPMIVFTGQMDYRPNVDAVTSFARRTMPLIRQRREDARFFIVGRKPTPAVEKLGEEDGIVVTGAVDDVRGWLAAADVVVAPLEIARGVQNKVLEAMAMARPVVASSAAFEGIEAEPGRDLLVADGPAAQAEAVLGLLDDPERAADIGEAARQRMADAYGWEARLAPLAAIIAPPARRAAA